MSGHFRVEPAALTDLAGTFERESADLARQIDAFSAGASRIGQAFGLLGACDGAMSKYTDLLNGTVRALGQLSQVLESDGQRLRVNAENYAAADQAAGAHVHSVAHAL
ncbi:type VII secretion target [Peterkaempfera sp. SMS 1(5)a]|uniref:type VII secretion target n=1 Tax=Peterkaempfera podocarpi TaxID=3232308 RepID=UPI00366F7E06